ncbi:hypothetical protein ATS76_13315 [Pseudoalteromonas sp. 10-33]|nr:hypothetical protein ATS76_13315 [Pseudoalteromonas sp. 10-33]
MISTVNNFSFELIIKSHFFKVAFVYMQSVNPLYILMTHYISDLTHFSVSKISVYSFFYSLS